MRAETQSGDSLRSLITHYTHVFRSFFAECVPRLAARGGSKSKAKNKQSLEKREKLLVYQKLNTETQELLDEGRKKEWANDLRFRSVETISQHESEDIQRSSGEAELPTQRIETDKNDFFGSKGQQSPPLMESRLAARDLKVFHLKDQIHWS